MLRTSSATRTATTASVSTGAQRARVSARRGTRGQCAPPYGPVRSAARHPSGGEVEVVPQQRSVGRVTWMLSRLASPCRTPTSVRCPRQPRPGGRGHFVDHRVVDGSSAMSNRTAAGPSSPDRAHEPVRGEMEAGERRAVPWNSPSVQVAAGLSARRPRRDGERPRPFRRQWCPTSVPSSSGTGAAPVTPAAARCRRGPAPSATCRGAPPARAIHLACVGLAGGGAILYTSFVSERTSSHLVTARVHRAPTSAPTLSGAASDRTHRSVFMAFHHARRGRRTRPRAPTAGRGRCRRRGR